MKPGDRVIWLHSPKRSFMKSLRLQRIPGEIVRIHRQKIRIRVWMLGRPRLVNVYLENILHGDEEQDCATDLQPQIAQITQWGGIHERN